MKYALLLKRKSESLKCHISVISNLIAIGVSLLVRFLKNKGPDPMPSLAFHKVVAGENCADECRLMCGLLWS
jgi:hypothetical protein